MHMENSSSDNDNEQQQVIDQLRQSRLQRIRELREATDEDSAQNVGQLDISSSHDSSPSQIFNNQNRNAESSDDASNTSHEDEVPD